MLTNIAWRNIWRSRLRSLVVICSIVLGVWALTFALAFMNGFIDSYVKNAIQYEYSHLQIHHPEWKKETAFANYIPDAEELQSQIKQRPEVRAVSGRTILTGMVSSSALATGIQIIGVDPEAEAQVTRIDSALVEGTFLKSGKRNPVVISEKLAKKLDLKLDSKLVLTFQDKDRNITAGAFRIAGIFNVPSEKLNMGGVFVRQQDLEQLYGEEAKIHELAIVLQDGKRAEDLVTPIKQFSKNMEVETWKQLAPGMDLLEQQSSVNMIVLVLIIMIALAFGIINTQLMAVLERTPELGMLMAVGMNRRRVFTMIVMETAFMGLIGTAIGLLLGYSTLAYLGDSGINLGAYSQGLDYFSLASLIFPTLSADEYINLAVSVFITAVIGAIYPAWMAIKLKPVVALRKS
jgi:putative ABC transport system permease protein